MKLQESGEMYLETILILSKKNTHVRSIDIASHTGYSKPSVSRAMGILKKGEFITIDSLGHITLTEKGIKTAQRIYERHVILTEFLRNIGVNEKTASEDACKIEHHISDETFEKIKSHISNKTNFSI